MPVADLIDSFIGSQAPISSKFWRQCVILVNFTDTFWTILNLYFHKHLFVFAKLVSH